MCAKPRQAVGAVLEEVAPNQSAQLWKTLVSYKSLEPQESSSDSEEEDDENVDHVLMATLSDCYMNMGTWQVLCQMLSIVADKLAFRTMKRWIPGLTWY